MFLFSISEGQATGIMTYDDIIKGIDKQLQREYELEDKKTIILILRYYRPWYHQGKYL